MNICINYHEKREWIELPADIEEIAEMFEVDLDEEPDFGDEISIEDIETDLDFKYSRLGAYDLDDLNALAECENDYHDEAVAISEAQSLNEVDYVTCRNANLIKGVETSEELGEALVDIGYLDPIPAHLKDYIDYRKFGDSFEYDGDFTSTGFLFNL